MTPRVLFNITHGFQARMLLRTAIASELIDRGVELVILSPNADEPYFRQEFDRPGFHLERMPVRPSRVEKTAVEFRQYFLMNPSLGETLDFKRIQYRTNHPGRYWLPHGIGNLALGRYPRVRRAYQAAEARFFDGSEFDAVLRDYQPQLVVTGTPGFIPSDAHLLRASKRAGIPTATVVLSWDNLTSKGFMGAQPDRLLVWNEVMRDEALRYHDFGGPIIEVGAAQFDVYPAVRQDFDPHEFRSKHGVPAGRPLVVWGTINEGIYPRQIDLLRSFVERLHEIPGPPYLWVRAHPQSVHGPHTALADAYRELAGPDVHVELPPVASEALPWDLPTSDLHHLAKLLTTADVVITPQSTLTLDAACADTPVINLAVDEDFCRCFEYTHYKNVVKQNGALIVESLDELVAGVAGYIVAPTREKDGREAIVVQQMGAWFGQAGRRTAEVLAQLATPPANGGADR